MIALAAVCSLASLLLADEPRLGVTVPGAVAGVTDSEWSLLRELGCRPNVLLLPSGDPARGVADLTGWREQLAAFAEHGLLPAATPVPHLPTVPWAPEVDETGAARADRQNPFDPAFREAWLAYLRATGEGLRGDDRVSRLYVAPPSYFGEFEYYLGPDWSSPKFLCYSDLARASFAGWLAARDGTPVGGADTLLSPKPDREGVGPDLRPEWLDLQEWRSQHLASLASEGVHALAGTLGGEAGFLTAVGDYGAAWGTDTAALAGACRDLPRVVLHHTNGHSLADTQYVRTIVRHYGLARLITENDGNRFGRGEIAKLTLVALLAGVDEYNYSYDAHLLDRADPPARTDSARALADAGTVLARFHTAPPRREVAFLHSNTTAWIRPPEYRNRDVSHVYDAVLANADRPDAVGYSWARWLDLPDVTGERLVADGDLEGRRLVILPSTGPTVLREEAVAALERWVGAGGTLVAFGSDPFGPTAEHSGLRLSSAPPAAEVTEGSGPLVVREECLAAALDGQAGVTAPVWSRALEATWRPLVTDAAGGTVVAERLSGEGRVVVLAAPVPANREARFGSFYQGTVPALLRALGTRAGCRWSHALEATGALGDGSPPLVVGYAGRDSANGRHLFVAGAAEAGAGRLRLTVGPELAGPAELLLVDVRGATAEGAAAVRQAGTADLYRDPTNQPMGAGAVIPWTVIEFDAGEPLEFTLSSA